VEGDERSPLQFPDLAKLELDELIDQLVDRAQGVKRAQGRLRSLLRAIETITGDLALETVLRSVVEAACELANARYGALGVLADGAVGLEQFIHVGIDPATADRIGHLPEGKGLLGALIHDPRPIRLTHMSDDVRSTGFPANHPPMESFIGVPIHVRGEVYGNLYLAESARGAFSAEDEQLLVALAAAAGAAISNARLYQELQRLFEESRLQQRWLEASVEIGAQMLAAAGEDPLQLIARRAIDISGADLVSVSLVSDDNRHLVVEVAYGVRADDLLGRRFPLTETLGGEVVRTGNPILLADASSSDSPPTQFASVIEAGPVMVLPLAGTGQPRGVLTLIRTRGQQPFSQVDLAMANGFAAHASVALELTDARAAEQRLVLLEDRDRIAKDLHDHVIQELFAIGLSMEGAAAQIGPDTTVGQRLGRRAQDIDRTIRRIRTSIFQLRGNFLDTEGGLRQRILEVATDLAPVLGFTPHVAFAGLVDLNLNEELVDDVLACVRETLTNVARHASANSAVIDVVMVGDEITVTVTDDGVGPLGATRSSGTANLRSRAEKWNGSFEMAPGAGRGTVVTWKARIR
jgi:signal transduction histidine kinase